MTINGEEIRAAFERWFEAIHGRKWDDIRNAEQDVESMVAWRAWSSAATWQFCHKDSRP